MLDSIEDSYEMLPKKEKKSRKYSNTIQESSDLAEIETKRARLIRIKSYLRERESA